MLEEEVAMLQAVLGDTEDELDTTKGTLTTTLGELDTTQNTLTTTQNTLTTTQNTLTETQNTLTTTQNTLTETQNTLTTTQDTLTETRGTLTTAQNTLMSTQDELDSTKTLLTNAQDDLDSKEQALNTLLLKASVTTVTELSAKLDEFLSLRNRVDGLLARAGVETLTELGTQLASDSALQNEVNTLLQATGAATLTALQTSVASLNSQISSLQTQLGQARQQAQNAQGQVNELTQQADANERARGLLAALEMIRNEAGTAFADVTPDQMTTARVNQRQTDIELAASPLTGSTRRSGDFYTATLSRTAPGVNQPGHKVIAYTDREKSRTFAEHYASSIMSNLGGTTSNPRFVNAEWVSNDFDLLDTDGVEFVSEPSRGGHPLTIPNAAVDPDEREVPRLSAKVHGVSGHYGCYNTTSNAACEINVAAEYDPPADDNTAREELTGLTITPEEGGTLYFDPGSGTISLLGVVKPGAPATLDGEYITFGWWRETPAMSDGMYEAAVFASVVGGTYSNATESAEYEGPAVGLYVDRTSEGGTTTYESGEFTATTILRATFTGTTPAVEGDVTNFRTTHGTKNWHVKLSGTGGATVNTSGTAEIVQVGTDSSGTWERAFLERPLAHRLAGDTQPIAVTGRFDVSIPNLRHITGAFGAHRTTDPIGQ